MSYCLIMLSVLLYEYYHAELFYSGNTEKNQHKYICIIYIQIYIRIFVYTYIIRRCSLKSIKYRVEGKDH